MSNRTKLPNSLFILSSLVAREGVGLEVDALLRLADRAQASRNNGALKNIVQGLKSLPLNRDELQATSYYEAQLSREDLSSLALLETISDFGLPRYRTLSMISLGVASWTNSDYDSTSRFFKEASALVSKTRPLDIARCYLVWDQGVLLGTLGDHKGALKMLQVALRLAFTLRHQYPAVYFEILNCCAVELAACGFIDLARHYSDLALASPFSPSYPEWQDTADEIGRGTGSSKSKVLRSRRFEPGNVVRPEFSLAVRPVEYERGGGELIQLSDWLQMRSQEKPREDQEPTLTREEMFSRLVAEARKTDNETMREVLRILEEKNSKNARKT